MARTTLQALQSTIAAALTADAWFMSVPVFAYSGFETDAIDAAIAETGFVVIVDPIKSVAKVDNARGMAVARALFSIEIWENPLVNQAGINKNILEAVSKVLRIVTLLDSGPGELPVDPDTDLASMTLPDDGTVAYIMPFSKIVQLS